MVTLNRHILDGTVYKDSITPRRKRAKKKKVQTERKTTGLRNQNSSLMSQLKVADNFVEGTPFEQQVVAKVHYLMQNASFESLNNEILIKNGEFETPSIMNRSPELSPSSPLFVAQNPSEFGLHDSTRES